MPQYTSGAGWVRPKKDIEEASSKNFKQNDRRRYSKQNFIATLGKMTARLFQRKRVTK